MPRCSPSRAVMEATRERPHLQLPAALPHLRRRARDRRGAGRRRLGLHPREILGEPVLGRRGRQRLHPLPVYRRALPLSPQRARRIRRSGATRIRIAAATACAPTSGSPSRSASASRISASSTPRPRATRSSSISTTRPAPSAASRAGRAPSSRSPLSASTSSARRRCAARTGSASNATSARSAS